MIYRCTDMEGAPGGDPSCWTEVHADSIRGAAEAFCEQTNGLDGLFLERGCGQVLVQGPCGSRAEVKIKAIQSITYYAQSVTGL